MRYVFDTNIVLMSILNKQFDAFIKERYRSSNNDLILSAVSQGELEALAKKRRWGANKVIMLRKVLEAFIIYPVKVQAVIDSYAQIDAFSQGKLLNEKLPEGMSARNMGKNDLWIAATTSVNQATLVTRDQDFDHLNPRMINIELISEPF